MKLNEKQGIKVTEKIVKWLGMEIKEKDDGIRGIGQVTKQEIAEFVMLDLINFELKK